MKIQRINNDLSYRGNAQNSEHTKDQKKINFNPAPAIGAVAGALIPVAIISKARKGKFSFDIYDSPSLLKNLATVLSVSISANLGGLLGGISTTKNPDDKKAKVKESIFDISTVLVPTTITTSLLGAAKKMNLKGNVPKVIAPIVGIGLGMPLCQKISNKIHSKFIDKTENPKNERKLKPQDYFVHFDDLLALMMFSGIPLAKKIHAEKLLPFIYAWCGFETGTKTAKDEAEENQA